MTVAIITTIFGKKIPQKYHIEWLNLLLWGGSLMLAIEHYAHGEIVPFFPFLTAAIEGPDAINVMLMEMMEVGGAMTLAIVGMWILILAVTPKLAQYHPQTKVIVST
jgi:hypothetical protein